MTNRSPTIAAIATPPGRGGIGVIRISGSGLQAFAQTLTGKLPVPRQATLAQFLAADSTCIDEGLLLFFPAPHSYTGEDVLELQAHGGPVVMQMLLARSLELGAKLAEPGEFTRRAFLNGKLDLAQAESVIDLIDASTQAAARAAVRSLSGDFSKEIHQWLDKLIDLRMLVEATLDFPEEEIDFLQAAKAFERLQALQSNVDKILIRAQQGSLLRNGLHVVFAGSPNVGKSSLLNRLAGQDRAIVTDVAGTTRDVLRESIQIEGIPLHIIDTAGLRHTEDFVEKIGIDRTWQEIEKSDVIVRLMDASLGATAQDSDIDAKLPEGVPVIRVFNKIDLLKKSAEQLETPEGVSLYLSAETGEGVELLRSTLLKIAGWQASEEGSILARERHLEALREVSYRISQAIDYKEQLELMAEELRLAQEAMNRITGEFGADDLLGVIFSRFCIGK